MNQVRFGVIGCGGMAQSHMKVLGEVARAKLTCVSDLVPDLVNKVAGDYKVQGFTDGQQLIDSGLCDAVVVATPHYYHPVYAIAALKRGLHVMSEKPVAVTARAAAEVNRIAAANPKLKYGVMFQMRTTPKWRKAREIISSGQLGDIQRVHWTATNWFRTQAYYDSGSWRATWAGEGGGVLLNQCPHNLDLFCWLAGLPSRVTCKLGIGRYHDMEVEDDVTALLEYPNGATGVFITSTGEFPGNDYLEIVGQRGRLIVAPGNTPGGGNALELVQSDVPASEFIRNSKSAWSSPTQTKMAITCPDGGSHKAVHENFIAAILDGTPMATPGAEGLAGVELANAMIMSGVTGNPVSVPTDHDAYDALMRDLIGKSKKNTKLPPML